MSVESNDGIDAEFINIFVHDLKTPLSAVKSYVDLIEQFGELNERQAHYAQRAMVGIARIETIVHNLLDYARISSNIPLERIPFSFHTIVEEALDLYDAAIMEKNIRLQVDVDPRLDDVIGDESLLKHVLQNLLGNAIKYNKTDGKVWLTVSDERAYVRVDIQDTGLGIAAEDIEKIFEKFYRGKTEQRIDGNGLGLAIARIIVQKHGGHIWVTSKQNEGSTFSFTIPRDTNHGWDEQTSDSAIRRALRGFDVPHFESAAESMDDVDDDIQEITERGEDSPTDEHED